MARAEKRVIRVVKTSEIVMHLNWVEGLDLLNHLLTLAPFPHDSNLYSIFLELNKLYPGEF